VYICICTYVRFTSNVIDNKICVLIFCKTFFSETFLIITRNEGEDIKMYIVSHVKYPLLLSDYNET